MHGEHRRRAQPHALAAPGVEQVVRGAAAPRGLVEPPATASKLPSSPSFSFSSSSSSSESSPPFSFHDGRLDDDGGRFGRIRAESVRLPRIPHLLERDARGPGGGRVVVEPDVPGGQDAGEVRPSCRSGATTTDRRPRRPTLPPRPRGSEAPGLVRPDVTSAAMLASRMVTSGVSFRVWMCCLAPTCKGGPIGFRSQSSDAPTGKSYGPAVPAFSAFVRAASSVCSRGRSVWGAGSDELQRLERRRVGVPQVVGDGNAGCAPELFDRFRVRRGRSGHGGLHGGFEGALAEVYRRLAPRRIPHPRSLRLRAPLHRAGRRPPSPCARRQILAVLFVPSVDNRSGVRPIS